MQGLIKIHITWNPAPRCKMGCVNRSYNKMNFNHSPLATGGSYDLRFSKFMLLRNIIYSSLCSCASNSSQPHTRAPIPCNTRFNQHNLWTGRFPGHAPNECFWSVWKEEKNGSWVNTRWSKLSLRSAYSSWISRLRRSSLNDNKEAFIYLQAFKNGVQISLNRRRWQIPHVSSERRLCWHRSLAAIPSISTSSPVTTSAASIIIPAVWPTKLGSDRLFANVKQDNVGTHRCPPPPPPPPPKLS